MEQIRERFKSQSLVFFSLQFKSDALDSMSKENKVHTLDFASPVVSLISRLALLIKMAR